MGYAGRRRIATLAGAAGAAALTALGAWALGGHAPNPDTSSSSVTAAPRRERTVTRTIEVTRHVRAPATSARRCGRVRPPAC